MELKRIIHATNQNHATSYLWPRGWGHTHTHIFWQDESDFKKPGKRWWLAHAWFTNLVKFETAYNRKQNM